MNISNKIIRNFFFSYSAFSNLENYLNNFLLNNDFNNQDEVIKLDGANISKAQILDLQNHYQKKDDIKRALIIYHAEKLSKEVINAFLLFLEENKEIYFLFISNMPHLVLNTLKSRCVKINIACAKDSLEKQFLKYKITEEYLKEFCLYSFDSIDQIDNFFQNTMSQFEQMLVILKTQNCNKYFDLQTWIKNEEYIKLELFVKFLQFFCSYNDDFTNQLSALLKFEKRLFNNINRTVLLNTLLLIFRN